MSHIGRDLLLAQDKRKLLHAVLDFSSKIIQTQEKKTEQTLVSELKLPEPPADEVSTRSKSKNKNGGKKKRQP